MRTLLAGLAVAVLGCSTTKEAVATPAAPQPVEVITPSSPPAKVIVVPNN
jgi:hypothetical protein